ncbi:MAG: maleylpyruvate isomerase family mycothiol-dependent enzyme [Actinomycetes bacterium]
MRTPDDLLGATETLLRVAADLDDAAIAAPSLLPGWTRGHVLAHLARNADGFVNLLEWARTGVETPMYASRERRDADIEAGSARSAEEHREDLRASAERLRAAWESLAEDRLDQQLRLGSGRLLLARDIPWGRVREIEIHLVDLATGVTFADLPLPHLEAILRESVGLFSARYESGEDIPALTIQGPNDEAWGALGEHPRVAVRGSLPELVAWVTGRSDGSRLHAAGPDGPTTVPTLPAWA